MMLFDAVDNGYNILPYDGCVNYFGKIFDENTAKNYFETLYNNIEWQNDEVKLFGKEYITARKVAWYSVDRVIYTYSNKSKIGLHFTKELLELKSKIEIMTSCTFNSCLLNLYHNGREGMGWHSDDEPSIVKNSAIASISFGVDRKFSFKHKGTKETKSITLENGSLLIMKNETQTNWLHSLPKSTKIFTPRINLTFRLIKL